MIDVASIELLLDKLPNLTALNIYEATVIQTDCLVSHQRALYQDEEEKEPPECRNLKKLAIEFHDQKIGDHIHSFYIGLQNYIMPRLKSLSKLEIHLSTYYDADAINSLPISLRELQIQVNAENLDIIDVISRYLPDLQRLSIIITSKHFYQSTVSESVVPAHRLQDLRIELSFKKVECFSIAMMNLFTIFPFLHQLKLVKCPFQTDEALPILMEGVRNSKTLKSLMLKDCFFNHEEYQQLLCGVEGLPPHVKTFAIEHADVSKPGRNTMLEFEKNQKFNLSLII